MSKIIEVESCGGCWHLWQDYDDHDNAIHICTHPNSQMIDNRIRHIDEIDPDCPLKDKNECFVQELKSRMPSLLVIAEQMYTSSPHEFIYWLESELLKVK